MGCLPRERAGSAPDRREATHVLLRSAGDLPIVTDGLRMLERASAGSIWGLWVSSAVGIVALAHLLVVGAVRSVGTLRRGGWRDEPLRWPALCLVLLLGGVQRVRAGVGTPGACLDLAAIAGLLQWCAVLAAWGLVPLVMWR